jgi:hypothetical protein
VRHLAPLATNPFLLPTLICQRLTEAIYIAIDNTFNKLHRAEMSSGQTGIGVIGEDGNIMRPGRCDDPHLPVTILGVSQLAISIEAYAEGHLLTVKSVKEELGRFPWDLLPEDKKRRARAQNGIIGRHLDWIVHTLKLAKIRAGHLRQRADVQTAAVCVKGDKGEKKG